MVFLLKLMQICNKLSNKKVSGYDPITAEVIKVIYQKTVKYIINASFKLRYVPEHWKIAEVVVIQNPSRPPSETASFVPISLWPQMAKVMEKWLHAQPAH